MVKVFFDTTVLCSAIRSPFGLCMGLLDLALAGFIEPVITQEVVAEFDRNCRIGIRGKVYVDQEIADFCQVLAPLLSAEMIQRVAMGRAQAPLFPILEAGTIRIVQPPVDLPDGLMVGELEFIKPERLQRLVREW